jgi:hypothetical protein
MTSPLIDAILSYLSSAPRLAVAGSRPGVADLAAAIRDRRSSDQAVLTRALVEQLNQRLKR